MQSDVWAVGDAYEAYIGRWSRPVATGFLHRLDSGSGGRWLDIGCGTGALTAAIATHRSPTGLVGVDPSVGFLTTARSRIPEPAAFVVGDARRLPFAPATFDAAVSALSLNFVPDPTAAAAEAKRVTRPGGVVAAYVWDYAEGMQLMGRFWDAATAVDPGATELAEAASFPLCAPGPLSRLWTDAGLGGATVEAVEVPTVFVDFDDYWRPFLGGQGPAPAYTMSLPEATRVKLRERLRQNLPTEPDGSIRLTARAWAVRGTA